MDPKAIETLYRMHGSSVLRRARRLLGSEHDAGEVLHDIFTSLLDHPAQFAGQSSPTTWLYAATTHACLNRLRNHRSRARIHLAHPPSGQESAPSNPEAASILRDLLARVPEALAQVAVYHYADEMTHEEIARVLGCSRRHVGDLLERLHEHVAHMESPS